MKSFSTFSVLASVVVWLLGAGLLEAKRRDPAVPIVITASPGSITTHAEVPVAPSSLAFSSKILPATSPSPPPPAKE